MQLYTPLEQARLKQPARVPDRGPMLLIIEKDPGFSDKLKQSIKIEGVKTFLVDSLKDALFLLDSMSADIILANLSTLGSTNEIDQLLRASSSRQTPILFIDGFSGTAGLADHVRARAQGEIIKLPFNSTDLTTRLTTLRTGGDPLIGQRIGPEGNQVEIIRKLGKGAMGEVYEGLELSLDRKVAVKLLLAERANDEDMNRRFRQEARAVAQMRSPNIVSVFFVGAHKGRPYLVMEYIGGPNLSSLLRKRKRLEPREALRITREILSGLAHAHQLGKVHRDMKPANVMLTKEGQVVILDFGLVRDDSAQDLTQSGMILGTPRYISPEQIRGLTVDQRSDLYATGIMLYELLTGRPPFVEKDHMAVLMKHLNEPLPRPDQSLIDSHLFAIIEQLTEKTPEKRFQNAAEATEALDSYLIAAGYSSVVNPTDSAFDGFSSGRHTVANLAPSSPSMASTSPGFSHTPSSVRAVRSLSHDSKPIPDDVIKDLMSLFTEVLGPLAPKLAKKDATANGLDLGLLPAARWSDLLNLMAARIDDDDKRSSFVDRAVLLKERF